MSYNVRDFLEQALVSIEKSVGDIDHEIFIVDNASSDGSAEWVRRHLPAVRLIENDQNVGFARANNQAISRCTGKYICLINPDTLVQNESFKVLIDFMEQKPEAGVVGCKVINPDGSLQLACRRSYPTPWVAFTKVVGLARLFPTSRLFGRYNLTYLDPEKVSEVDAISGSFMLLRRRIVDQVGGLDEDFFMYGEDLDWCYRIREAGWKIYYNPATQIVHFKGESSKKSPFEQRRLFYEAMRLFVKKHFGKSGALFPSWMLILAIYMRAMVSFLSTAVRYIVLPSVDLFLLTTSLAIAIFLRFRPDFPWLPFIPVHVVYSLVLLTSLAGHGLYSRWRFSGAKSFSAVFLGLLVNSTLTFFFKQYAFSRAVVLWAGVINLAFVPGWRFGMNWLAHFKIGVSSSRLGKSLLSRKTLIVGDKKSTEKVIARLRSRLTGPYLVHGVVLTDADVEENDLAGVPIIGPFKHLLDIIEREKIKEVIFSTDRLPYDHILSTIAGSYGAQIRFKLVPNNLDVIIGKASIDYISDIPFIDLEYKLHTAFNQIVKRAFDILVGSVLLVSTSPVLLWLRYVKKLPLKTVEFFGIEQQKCYYREFDAADGERLRWRSLPKLFAVIRGDMSLVGREIHAQTGIRKWDASRLIKPGLTGLEQINSSLELSVEDRKRYQLFYLKNYSLFLDVEILLKSIFKNH